MVVGIYGLLYWHAAWKLEYARPIIAIGLLGKVLGPIGMVISLSDHWPRRLAMLNLYNDVIWWLPFTLFLLRGTRLATWLIGMAPWCCAGFHALGHSTGYDVQVDHLTLAWSLAKWHPSPRCTATPRRSKSGQSSQMRAACF